MSSVTFQILGGLRAKIDQREIDLGPPKQRAVLAVLLLSANEIVATDRIVDSVWGENPPRTAEHSVQIYVSELRKALANGGSGDVIETRPPGYVLNVNPEVVDAQRFERMVRDGLTAVRTGDIAGGRPKLENALDAWAGPPLLDFAYEDFAQGHIRSLQELRADVLETLAGVYLELGDLDRVRDLARQASEANPLREEPRRLAMLSLYISGRQAEALRYYGDYHDLLAEELGIEPSEGLRDLEERILLQDPTLDLKRQASADGNPYRGLRAFTEDDAEVYFGRERLVADVLAKFADGSRFVSIVGPSGSGKSSAARAGVLPVLRAEGKTVVVVQPGTGPLWELAGGLDRAGFGSRATLLRRFENDPGALVGTITRPVVLIVDQFEELFTLAAPDDAVRFSELIAAGIRDPASPLRVIATLRADYYDRPLSMPALAGVFSDSVVSVKPMTPLELERAVVEPARAAGVTVEPALLTQLVADMGDEPGALPLLQFTLFELFERMSVGLTLADYRQLGGIHGALTGGADQLMEELDSEGRDLVEQLMMRMIQKGRALNTARPVALRDLLDLGVDRVALQGVLEAFGSRRLLTFDRDASGSAVVEMAHEYLISEWPRLSSWIEVHSDDLDRLHALDGATNEWVSAEGSEDYLLRGERLDRFEFWRQSTTLRLTKTEVDFIGISLDLRKREETVQAEQAAKEIALTRRARRRLWAFGAAVAALAGAVTVLIVTLIPPTPPDVILWYSNDGSEFDDMMATGLDTAAEEHDLDALKYTVEPGAGIDEVEDSISRGTGLILLEQGVIGGSEQVNEMIAAHPEAQFVWIDCDSFRASNLGSNESCIISDHLELGFLAGVAAASATETDHIGVVVGVNIDFMFDFQSGFEQGAAHVNPNIEVDSIYLTGQPDFSGFSSPTLGALGAKVLIDEGADVIFQAAGDSGFGVIGEVSSEAEDSQRGLWSIGVDVDESYKYLAWVDSGWLSPETLAEWQSHLLTSIIKRIDFGVSTVIDQYVMTGSVSDFVLDVGNGGIDYVTTGDHLTDQTLRDLEAAKQAFQDGSVTVQRQDVDDARLLSEVVSP